MDTRNLAPMPLPMDLRDASRRHALRSSTISLALVATIPILLIVLLPHLSPDTQGVAVAVSALAYAITLAVLLVPVKRRSLADRLRAFPWTCPSCQTRLDMGQPWVCSGCERVHGAGFLGALNPSPPTVGCDRTLCDKPEKFAIECPACKVHLLIEPLNSSDLTPENAEGLRIARFVTEPSDADQVGLNGTKTNTAPAKSIPNRMAAPN